MSDARVDLEKVADVEQSTHDIETLDPQARIREQQLVEIFIPRGPVTGVGIVVSPSRILTTAQVAYSGKPRIVLRTMAENQVHEPSVVWADRETDLALLECSTSRQNQRFPEFARSISTGRDCVILTRTPETSTPGAETLLVSGRIFGQPSQSQLEIIVESDQEILSGSAVFAGGRLIAIVQSRRGSEIIAIPLLEAASDKAFLKALGTRAQADTPIVFLSHSRRDKPFVRRLRE